MHFKGSLDPEGNATVPICYEARLAKIALPDDKKPVVDEEFEDITEGEEESVKGKTHRRHYMASRPLDQRRHLHVARASAI
jgi:type I site-specific restriction-modification system R (restriction) subunit